jgi:hypothetical protein
MTANLMGFAHAVDWSESWLVALLSIHPVPPASIQP